MVRGYEITGRLYKKRGGLGRHVKNPWVSRTFALGYDGVLAYFDNESFERERGRLNLVRAEAELSMSIEDEYAPTTHILVITHIQGQRWKLCADTIEDLNSWKEKMAKFCRSKAVLEIGAVTRNESTDSTNENKAYPPHKEKIKNKGIVPVASRRKLLPYQRQRRASKSVKEYAINTTRTTKSSVRIALACSVVNIGFMLALSTDSKISWFILFLLINVHISMVILRCLAEAPPVSETIIAMIIPPARLPSFLVEEDLLPPFTTGTSTTSIGNEDTTTASFTVLRKSSMDILPMKKQQGLREVPFDPEGGTPATWSKAPASSFKVRQLGYAKSKAKAPSAEAFYNVVAVHVFDVEKRINCMCKNNGEYFRVDPATTASPHPDVPALFVVNAQIPAETGPFRVKLDADGAGYHVVIVCELDAGTAQELTSMQKDPALFEKEYPQRYRALRLLITYCKNAPHEPQVGAKHRGRFKVIAQVRNIDECSIPNVAKSYNGKPALINKTGILTTFGGAPLSSSHGMEMDVNVHAFGFLARSGLQTIYRDFQDFILSIAFCLEARSDDELPENILASVDLNHCNWTMATPI